MMATRPWSATSYLVATGVDKDFWVAIREMAEKVSFSLQGGWSLQGGISVTYGDGAYVVLQALTREEKGLVSESGTHR